MQTKIKKYSLLIVVLFSVLSCLAQPVRPPIVVERGKENTIVTDSRASFLKNLTIPRYSDTLSIDVGLDYDGSLVYIRADRSVYFRIVKVDGIKEWVRLLKLGDETGGGPGGGVTAFNSRTGNVVLNYSDVVNALGYAPINPNGTVGQYITGDGQKITFPTIPAQINLIQGDGITITGVYPNITISSLGGGGSLAYNGNRPSTSLVPEIRGLNPGTATIPQLLDWFFFPSEFPTFSLTGGVTQEMMAAGANLNYVLNYTAGRAAGTLNLDSIRVNGVYKTFVNPAAPGSVNGTHAVSIARNITTVIDGYTVTIDGRKTSATTTFSFTNRRYWLWLSDTTGISSGALDATILGGASELSASRVKTYNTGAPIGTQYPVFVYIGSAGALTSLKMNGFESLLAWKNVQRNFTTATGYTAQYRIYWGNNGQTAASNIETQ